MCPKSDPSRAVLAQRSQGSYKNKRDENPQPIAAPPRHRDSPDGRNALVGEMNESGTKDRCGQTAGRKNASPSHQLDWGLRKGAIRSKAAQQNCSHPGPERATARRNHDRYPGKRIIHSAAGEQREKIHRQSPGKHACPHPGAQKHKRAEAEARRQEGGTGLRVRCRQFHRQTPQSEIGQPERGGEPSGWQLFRWPGAGDP